MGCFRATPANGPGRAPASGPESADFVAEIGVQTARETAVHFLKPSIVTRWIVGRLTLDFTDACNAYAAHKGTNGGGRATNLASLRRFCAIAANVNSNWAPHGPRNRSRRAAGYASSAQTASRHVSCHGLDA